MTGLALSAAIAPDYLQQYFALPFLLRLRIEIMLLM
jgi:hypothetical protein